MDDSDYPISDRLGTLLEQSVNINLSRLQDGQPILPSLLCLETGQAGYGVTVFNDPDVQQAIATARSTITQQSAQIEVYVISYAGQLPTTDGIVRSLLFEMGERGQAVAFRYMVGYTFSGDRLQLLDGFNGVLGETEPLLNPV